MKRLLAILVLSLAMVAETAFAAASIIVVSHGHAYDPFWSKVKAGIDQAVRDGKVKANYRTPADMVEMARLIDEAVGQEPDGIVVSIPDADALGPSIRQAIAAGIPVISVNSGGDDRYLGVEAYVGPAEYELGLILGRRMKAEGITNALCVNHEKLASDLRCEGFARGLGGNVKVLVTSNDPTSVKNEVLGALSADSAIDSILTFGILSALAASEALEQSGKLRSVKLLLL